MRAKYVKCFDNREAHGNGSAFEQVNWCKNLKEAEKEFEMDVGWAKKQMVDQYIFKLVKIQEVDMEYETNKVHSTVRKVG